MLNAAAMAESLSDIFGTGGALSLALERYEERPQQLEMAEAVAGALRERQKVIIEAATGTGKTIAYLVPAILSRRRTLVSTATKNLQDQIFNKDIPFLKSVLPRDFDAVLLKGRQNYLCLWQYEEFSRSPDFKAAGDSRYWASIRRWAKSTTTGDRAELSRLPDNYATWSELSISADSCTGRKCAHYDDCFVVKARSRAATADIVVVNHHLFFADLSLRSGTKNRVELLPSYDAVVFDEAHNLNDTAASFFGLQVSNFRLSELYSDAERSMLREAALTPAVTDACRSLKSAADGFFGAIKRLMPRREDRVLSEAVFAEGGDDLERMHARVDETLNELRSALGAASGGGEVAEKLVQRTETIATELHSLVRREAPDVVYLTETRGRGVFLRAFPIDLQHIFRDLLHSACATQIYTSATLTTDGDFRWFREQLGLSAEVKALPLEPVFDYMKQALLYVPDHLPAPNAPDFVDALAPTIKHLIEITEGRAFVLFTSYRNMNRAWELLSEDIPHTTLLQGTQTRSALLKAFREDAHSVLFATQSFWEGVDVQGDALSLVIIDKLPFSSPFDPVAKARLDHIRAQGKNPFSDHQVPEAAIALKQGFGRLIRHREDRGVIAILDSRIVNKGYGKRFLRSLPRCRRTRDINIVEQWWAGAGSSEDLAKLE